MAVNQAAASTCGVETRNDVARHANDVRFHISFKTALRGVESTFRSVGASVEGGSRNWRKILGLFAELAILALLCEGVVQRDSVFKAQRIDTELLCKLGDGAGFEFGSPSDGTGFEFGGIARAVK